MKNHQGILDRSPACIEGRARQGVQGSSGTLARTRSAQPFLGALSDPGQGGSQSDRACPSYGRAFLIGFV